MSETTVLAAFQTLLTTNTNLSPLVGAVYSDIPAFPYTGRYPFIIIQPSTQTSEYAMESDYVQQGYYTLLYMDQLSFNSGLTVAQIMQAARTFAYTLRREIRKDYTLGGAVLEAGEGPGITTDYDASGQVEDVTGQPLYYVPIHIWVMDTIDT